MSAVAARDLAATSGKRGRGGRPAQRGPPPWEPHFCLICGFEMVPPMWMPLTSRRLPLCGPLRAASPYPGGSRRFCVCLHDFGPNVLADFVALHIRKP